MKILHIENMAGVASTLSRSQRSLGHQSDVLITWPNKFGYPIDYDRNYQGKGVRIPIEMMSVIKIASKYDVLHIHGGLSKKRLDIVLNKLITGKRMLFHFHGSETRMGYGTSYLWMMADGVVSTPDLLRHWPELTYVPNPIEKPKGIYEPMSDGQIKIVHFPTNRRFKGTDVIEKGVEILKNRGFSFEFKIIEGVAHSKVIEEMRHSHVVIDWMSQENVTGIPGIYGNVSLEAMALGRIAVAFIDPTIRPHYPEELPVRSPKEPNPESLADCLDDLITNWRETRMIAESGPKYVEVYHDSTKLAQRFIEKYERILE